jgi:hypothetical protein
MEVAGEMQRDGCNRTEAMRRIRRRKPALAESMNNEALVTKASDLPGMPSSETIAGERAKMNWNRMVEETAKRHGIDFTAAMSRTRKEHPELYVAFQTVGGSMDLD